MRLLQIVFFFEAGCLLAIVPWSVYWERNYFATLFPLLGPIITNDFVRGAVSGLGVINLAAGAADLISFFAARRVEEPALSIGRTPTAEE